MDVIDELTDLSGAPPHEVKAVADKAIKEIERLRDRLARLDGTHAMMFSVVEAITKQRAATKESE